MSRKSIFFIFVIFILALVLSYRDYFLKNTSISNQSIMLKSDKTIIQTSAQLSENVKRNEKTEALQRLSESAFPICYNAETCKRSKLYEQLIKFYSHEDCRVVSVDSIKKIYPNHDTGFSVLVTATTNCELSFGWTVSLKKDLSISYECPGELYKEHGIDGCTIKYVTQDKCLNCNLSGPYDEVYLAYFPMSFKEESCSEKTQHKVKVELENKSAQAETSKLGNIKLGIVSEGVCKGLSLFRFTSLAPGSDDKDNSTILDLDIIYALDSSKNKIIIFLKLSKKLSLDFQSIKQGSTGTPQDALFKIQKNFKKKLILVLDQNTIF